MRWLAIVLVTVNSIAYGGGLSAYQSAMNARYLGKLAHWLAPDRQVLSAVITKVIVPERRDEGEIDTDDLSQVKFEVRGGKVEAGEEDSLPPALPYAPFEKPADKSPTATEKRAAEQSENPTDESGMARMPMARMPQITNTSSDENGFSWYGVGGNFIRRLLASPEEIGYTIDASKVIPAGFHVGKQVRIQTLENSDVYTTTVLDLWFDYKNNINLRVRPGVGGKSFIAAKDVVILDD